MFSYFEKSQRRRRILNNIKSRRIIIDKFNIPLGIVPSEYVYPIEGTKIELKNTDNGDVYSYKISVSAEKIFSLYMKLLKLFPSYGTMIIERISEDVNRDFDVLMSDPDVSLNEIRKVFRRYNELWVECGFVGFGVIDELTEFEIFINLDKEIEINTSYKNMKQINRILRSYKLLNDDVSFISDYEHMHYSLSSIVADEGCSEADEYVFDYYDIINNLDGVLEQFDRILGVDRLKAVHLNDSMNPAGSRKDRHACIGAGCIGLDALVRIIRHPVLKNLPFILETPNELPGYAAEIALLRSRAEQ